MAQQGQHTILSTQRDGGAPASRSASDSAACTAAPPARPFPAAPLTGGLGRARHAGGIAGQNVQLDLVSIARLSWQALAVHRPLLAGQAGAHGVGDEDGEVVGALLAAAFLLARGKGHGGSAARGRERAGQGQAAGRRELVPRRHGRTPRCAAAVWLVATRKLLATKTTATHTCWTPPHQRGRVDEKGVIGPV